MSNLNLPENGTVVIVDEQQSEALPIIKALSKHGIACTYYTSKIDELPEYPIQYVRILFLDLQLQDGVTDPHQIATQLISVVKKIIRKDNGPYLLVIWSKNYNQYGAYVETELKKAEHGVVPSCVISFNKRDCLEEKREYAIQNQEKFMSNILDGLDKRIDEDEITIITERLKEQINSNFTTYFDAKPNAIQTIETHIAEGLKKAGVFHLFVIWENLVKRSSGQIVKQISDVIATDEHWESNMRDVFNRMGVARIGQNSVTPEQLIKHSAITFTNSFTDTLETEINRVSFPEHLCSEPNTILSIKTNEGLFSIVKAVQGFYLNKNGVNLANPRMTIGDLEKEIKSLQANDKVPANLLLNKYFSLPSILNTKLHLEINPTQDHLPGNIYLIGLEDPELKKSRILNYFKSVLPEQISEFKLIELEVSPICDYAQNKWKKSRLLPGILFPEKFENAKSGDFYYPIEPVFAIGGQTYRMIFDFHLFKAMDKEVINQRAVTYRLKRELLLDIIAKLSSHVVRPGVMFVS